MSDWYLGVDGGGTKTRACVAELAPDGSLTVLGSGEAGGSNPYSVGWSVAQAEITAAIAAACEDAAESMTSGTVRPAAAVLAIAGCASAEARDRLQAWADSQSWSTRVRVVPDTAPLFAELPPDEPAIGLIAGTGSAAVVRHPDGEIELVGGWGYLIDDAGSGYAIGRSALRWLTRRSDQSVTTISAFADAVLEAAGIAELADLKPTLYGANDPRAWVAGLARVVVEAAGKGDSDALRLVEEQADALAQLAENVAGRLAGERPRLLLSGSLLTSTTTYRDAVVDRLQRGGWNEAQIGDAPDAALGCVRLATRLAKDS